jgi:hypothetical protein
MRLLKILVLLAVIGGAIAAAAYLSDRGGSSPTAQTGEADSPQGKGSPMLEERYGFTSQGLGQ